MQNLIEMPQFVHSGCRSGRRSLWSNLLSSIRVNFVVVFIFPLILKVSAFPDECTDACVSQMQMMLDTIPSSKNSTTFNLQRPFLNNKTPIRGGAEAAGDAVTMQKFFSTVCQSYEKVDKCLQRCGSNSRQMLMIKQTYAGLKLICKDHRRDFFAALPCLTKYEPMAMEKCSREIQQSHITTANFTEAIVNKEFYSIRLKFRYLCKDLSAMITCMEPIVRLGCGDRSTNLMLHFITLEFSSFEQLYSQLAFNEPLPADCRTLLSLSNGHQNSFTQKSYTTYVNSASDHLTILIWGSIVAILWNIVQFVG